MSSFSAGFAGRHNAAAKALHQSNAVAEDGFAPADLRARASAGQPKSFSPQSPVPKHFSPAEPGTDPTEGWDPFDAPGGAAESFVDPIAHARGEGFAEGLAHAESLAREEHERNIALMQAITHALRDAGRIDRDQLALQLRKTIVMLVSKLVGEVGIAADLLAARITAAVQLIADAIETATLRVNPDDLPLLAGKLPSTVTPLADPTINRGGFVLESAATVVEEGPELWLEQLGQAIERVAVPAC